MYEGYVYLDAKLAIGIMFFCLVTGAIIYNYILSIRIRKGNTPGVIRGAGYKLVKESK